MSFILWGKIWERDVSIWGRTKNGIFTTKIAYETLVDEDRNNQQNKWKKIWELKVLERIRVFIWKVHWEGLKTKKLFSQRYLSDPFCNYCRGKKEAINHALRDYNSIRHVWLNLVKKCKQDTFFNSNLQRESWDAVARNMGHCLPLHLDVVQQEEISMIILSCLITECQPFGSFYTNTTT